MSQSNAQLFQNYRFDPLASPLLDENQAGHLRRMTNLAARLPDDWSGMQGKTTLQEDFSSLRFQLAYMSYALALTHVHRLPAAPVVFKKSFDQLIQKMLSPDVWTYWHYVSTGNGPHNRSLGELPARWDPVETDNIMYRDCLRTKLRIPGLQSATDHRIPISRSGVWRVDGERGY